MVTLQEIKDEINALSEVISNDETNNDEWNTPGWRKIGLNIHVMMPNGIVKQRGQNILVNQNESPEQAFLYGNDVMADFKVQGTFYDVADSVVEAGLAAKGIEYEGFVVQKGKHFATVKVWQIDTVDDEVQVVEYAVKPKTPGPGYNIRKLRNIPI